MSVPSLRESAAPRPPVADVAAAPRVAETDAARNRRPAAAPETPSPFARLLHALGDEAARGEAAVRSATGASRAGRDLAASELLVLQAGVYRYSESIDLASKLVDRASSGVKTVIAGQ